MGLKGKSSTITRVVSKKKHNHKAAHADRPKYYVSIIPSVVHIVLSFQTKKFSVREVYAYIRAKDMPQVKKFTMGIKLICYALAQPKIRNGGSHSAGVIEDKWGFTDSC
jgi:hypothetical protein